MDVSSYYRSLTAELESVKDRVRNFIEDKHWLTHGEWQESVLRSLIAQRLPSNVKIGHGFVVTENGPTTQCDILIYRSDIPILFREGDLVFVTPDAVKAIIEVKSKTTRPVFAEAIQKLAAIGLKLGRHRNYCNLGLFSYETTLKDHDKVLDMMQGQCRHRSQIVNLVNLGCSTFVRYWDYSPHGGDENYEQWHSYDLENMSAGYFIANVLDSISPESIARHSKLWFPEDSKEFRLVSGIMHLTKPPTRYRTGA